MLPQGAINFHELFNAILDVPDVELNEADETIFVPYSSGTTGFPKGVELSSYNLVANVEQTTSPELKVAIDAVGTYINF